MTAISPDPGQIAHSSDDDKLAQDAKTAADLIREKVARIYAEEPAATSELLEAEEVKRRSKHQEFMYELSNSGLDLATIQNRWHDYYQKLPAHEKHEVWQEFYDSQSQILKQPLQSPHTPTQQALSQLKQQVTQPQHHRLETNRQPKLRDARSSKQIQAAIKDKVTAGGTLRVKHHVQSLLFGLGIGATVIIIFLFSFFNEVIIAPFIQPSRVAAATPIIVGANSIAPTTTPEVIIPKINVEIPVDYSETSTNEADIENDLEQGVVHYPTTVDPGQDGNAAFFGHSSNNIFNKGKYKFAFVLLHTLVPGDTFYLTYNDKVYVYKVISKTVVNPGDVTVLGPVSGQIATATLITCDPPGTSINRLIVVGQQISPDPAGDTQPAATTASTTATTTELPGNGPTLWTKFSKTFAGKSTIIILLIAGFLIVLRWINRPRADEA